MSEREHKNMPTRLKPQEVSREGTRLENLTERMEALEKSIQPFSFEDLKKMQGRILNLEHNWRQFVGDLPSTSDEPSTPTKPPSHTEGE